MSDIIKDAVRAGCDTLPRCTYPDCGCTIMPRALQTAARAAAEAMREKAAQIERDVYFRLIGSEAMPCACGNGRIPTTSFSDATRTYAAAIRAISIEGETT